MFKQVVTRFISIAAIAALSMPFSIAQAQDDDPIDKAIKARQASMQLYSFYAGQLFAMAKGDQEYDAELAATLAENFQAVTHLKDGMMWLPGSDNEARQGDTRAEPDIWAEDSEVGDRFTALRTASEALVPVAGGGLDALRSQIGDVGEACKACHDDYRAKDF